MVNLVLEFSLTVTLLFIKHYCEIIKNFGFDVCFLHKLANSDHQSNTFITGKNREI